MAETQYNRSPLFMRKQPGGVWTIENLPEHPGNVWFVDSGATGATDAATHGKSPDAPFATLDYAVGLCTASNGDTIYVMPGHAETKSASGSLFALDVIGIHVIGLGEGALRPTFTFSDTGAATTISAANITLENVIFVCGIDSVLAPLTISAADVTLRNIEFRDATNKEFVVGITTTDAADRLHVDGLHYRGDMASGDALTIGIDLAGVADALIENCVFESKAASTAWVNFSTAVKNVHVRKCIFNDSTTTLTKDVVDTATGSTWSTYDCFDLRGGYLFAGGSGSALAAQTSATSAAVSTVDSKVVSVGAKAGSASTSAAVSTVDSKVASVGTLAGSGSTSAAVSTADSKIASVGTVAGSGATSAAVSTADSKITSVGTVAGSGATSVAVSTADSKITSVGTLAGSGATSAAVSTVSSLATVLNNWDVRTTKKTGLAIDGGDVTDVFTITGGPIEVLGLNMVVTTAVSANACEVHFLNDPTLASAADTEMCAGVDIASAAIGDVFSIIDADGTVAMSKNATGTQVGRMMEIGSQFVLDGAIDFKAANADPTTGVADVYLTWRPLVAGTTVTTS